MYLIEKLQNTQNFQKQAFEELEKAINCNPNELRNNDSSNNLNKKKKKNVQRN